MATPVCPPFCSAFKSLASSLGVPVTDLLNATYLNTSIDILKLHVVPGRVWYQTTIIANCLYVKDMKGFGGEELRRRFVVGTDAVVLRVRGSEG